MCNRTVLAMMVAFAVAPLMAQAGSGIGGGCLSTTCIECCIAGIGAAEFSSLACGAGTVEQDGECVPSATPPPPVVIWIPQVALSRGKVVERDLTMPADFELAFDIHPTGTEQNWASIVHYTNGGNGNRVPGIWFWPGTTKLHVVVGPNNHNINPGYSLPLNQWSSVRVQVAGNTAKITINGQHFDYTDLPLGRPAVTTGVTLYAGNPWHPAALADIRACHWRGGAGVSASLLAGASELNVTATASAGTNDCDDEDDNNNALVTAVIVLALALTVSLCGNGCQIYSSRQRGSANPTVDAQGESAPDDDAEGNDGDDDAEGNDGDDDAFEPTGRASVFAI